MHAIFSVTGRDALRRAMADLIADHQRLLNAAYAREFGIETEPARCGDIGPDEKSSCAEQKQAS